MGSNEAEAARADPRSAGRFLGKRRALALQLEVSLG